MTRKKLEAITKKLGTEHAKQAKYKKELAKSRDKFFNAVTEMIVANSSISQKVVYVDDDWEKDVPLWIERYHPGWVEVDQEEGDEGLKVILQEDPAKIKYAFYNQADGKLYQRNLVQEAPSLDTDWLAEEDPELWERISEPTRVLKDLESLKVGDQILISKYLVPGPLKLRLETPRKAKPEEIDGADDN